MEEKNIFALRLFFQIKTKNSIKSRVFILKMPFLGFKLSNSRKNVGIGLRLKGHILLYIGFSGLIINPTISVSL
jgi:hypothetical protein